MCIDLLFNFDMVSAAGEEEQEQKGPAIQLAMWVRVCFFTVYI